MSPRSLLVLSAALAFVALSSARAASFPPGLESPAERSAAFDAFAEAMTRNDAEAIDAGWRGRAGWRQAVAQGRARARSASDPLEFGLALRRLHAAYPSLHSGLTLAPEIELQADGPLVLPVELAVSEIGPGVERPALIVRSETGASSFVGAGDTLQKGDSVERIDGRPAAEWIAESRRVCRFPLAWQCDWEFSRKFGAGVLGWDARRPLRVDARRAGRPVTATYTRRPQPSPLPTIRPAEAGACESRSGYPGFALIYAGQNLCAYRSDAHPGVEVWRLRSFSYAGEGEFRRLPAEVEALWTRHWREAAPHVRRLVIDVSGNGGGEMPMPWYALLSPAPFQEQFAQYRRIPAFDDPELLSEAAWGGKNRLAWFAKLRSRSPELWATPYAYLPTAPQFCAPDAASCEPLPWPTRRNGFTGTVALLIDPHCVSSCSGFVWNILDVLGPRARAYGLPDSGDTNYARLSVALRQSEGRWTATPVASAQSRDLSPPAIARATVMVTRTTDAQGRVLSGAPAKVATVVPRRWDDSDASWSARALAAALADPELLKAAR